MVVLHNIQPEGKHLTISKQIAQGYDSYKKDFFSQYEKHAVITPTDEDEFLRLVAIASSISLVRANYVSKYLEENPGLNEEKVKSVCNDLVGYVT